MKDNEEHGFSIVFETEAKLLTVKKKMHNVL